MSKSFNSGFSRLLLVLTVFALPGCASIRSTIGDGASALASWANQDKVPGPAASALPVPPAPAASQPEGSLTAVATAVPAPVLAVAPAPVSAPAPVAAPEPLPVLDVPADAETARLMFRAGSLVSLRTRTLDIRPKAVAMMQRLCAKGIATEAVVLEAPRAAPQSFGCIRIYVSRDRAMNDAPDILVLDSREMFSRGIHAPAEHTATYREVELRQELKFMATRVN